MLKYKLLYHSISDNYFRQNDVKQYKISVAAIARQVRNYKILVI